MSMRLKWIFKDGVFVGRVWLNDEKTAYTDNSLNTDIVDCVKIEDECDSSDATKAA